MRPAMLTQRDRDGIVPQHFEQHPAVMRVVVSEAGEQDHRWPDVGVIGEDFAGDALMVDAGPTRPSQVLVISG